MDNSKLGVAKFKFLANTSIRMLSSQSNNDAIAWDQNLNKNQRINSKIRGQSTST